MFEYKVELEIAPESTPAATVSAARSDIADVSQLNTGFHTKKGKKGFFFSGGNKEAKSGCWLDGSFTFFSTTEKYPGWLGAELSQSDGTFTVAQTLTITPASTGPIIIRFDRVAGEYARLITIGSTIYTNYNYYFIIPEAVADTPVTLTFTKWSKANSVVKVLSIIGGLVLTYTRNNLRTVDYSLNISSDVLKFGILSNEGNFSVKDDGLLEDLNDAKMLVTGQHIKTYKDNVLQDTFVSSTYSNPDQISSKWTVNFTDELTFLEDEPFDGLNYETRTLKAIILSIIPNAVFIDCSYIDSITIPNSFLNATSKWNALVKCCNAGMLYVSMKQGIPQVRGII